MLRAVASPHRKGALAPAAACVRGALATLLTRKTSFSANAGSEGASASDPPFEFKPVCRGKRVVSENAQETAERLRRSDFGIPRNRRTSGAQQSAGAAGGRASTPRERFAQNSRQVFAHTHQDSFGVLGTQRSALQASSGGSWAAAAAEGGGEGRSADDTAQELVEKGSKRLMSSDDGREELRQGTFDLDRTTDRILEEGKKEATPEAQAAAEQQDVKDKVKSTVVSMSQTS